MDPAAQQYCYLRPSSEQSGTPGTRRAAQRLQRVYARLRRAMVMRCCSGVHVSGATDIGPGSAEQREGRCAASGTRSPQNGAGEATRACNEFAYNHNTACRLATLVYGQERCNVALVLGEHRLYGRVASVGRERVVKEGLIVHLQNGIDAQLNDG
jgi:hypothetical protein